jgi:translocation and assembly module TamB
VPSSRSFGASALFGGPIDQPTLDILALRTVGEVKAGCRSAAPWHACSQALFEPPCPTRTCLPTSASPSAGRGYGQAGLLTAAAGHCSRGESTVLQDRIKRRLGVEVLTVEAVPATLPVRW